MGTSTRKLQKKIKKILNPPDNDERLLEWDEAVIKAASATLKFPKTKKYFKSIDFITLLHGGISFLQSFKSGNYKEHFNIEEDIEKIDPTDTITVEKILESILDKIEEKNEIELSLLLRAFKITMAKMILENNKDLYCFIFEFCSNIILLTIMENITESLYDTYEKVDTSQYEEKVKEFAFKWVDINMTEIIKKYLDRLIDENEFINELINNITNVKGDF